MLYKIYFNAMARELNEAKQGQMRKAVALDALEDGFWLPMRLCCIVGKNASMPSLTPDSKLLATRVYRRRLCNLKQ
jgi:hypothetical protein